MSTLTLFDIYLFLGLGQGVFLIISIPLVNSQYKSANNTLTLIILFAMIMLAGRILFFSTKSEWILRLSGFVDTTIYLFGPLIYEYSRRLLNPHEYQKRIHSGHFVPAILHLIYCIGTLFYSIPELNSFYYSGSLKHLITAIEGMGLLSLFCYWLLSVSILIKNSSSKIYSASYLISVNQYLNFFLGTIGIVISLWFLSYFFSLLSVSFTLINYELIWVIFPVFFYIIGYFSLQKPEILRISLNKNMGDRLDQKEITRLDIALNQLISREAVYSDPELTLRKLSDFLNTSPNNLSWFLNQVHQKTFYQFINQARIDAFQSKILEKEHHSRTLLSLAFDVGFNSKSTFNKAFKTLKGNTPSSYVKSLKNDVK